MDTGIPLFFSEIEYLLLETIPLETIMRVVRQTDLKLFNSEIWHPDTEIVRYFSLTPV